MSWDPEQARSIARQHDHSAHTIRASLTPLEATSYRSRELHRRYQDYIGDPRAIPRHAQQCCRFCEYLDSGLAGQAFTAYTCQACQRSELWHNTNTPVLCQDCAQAFAVCRQCGGTMD